MSAATEEMAFQWLPASELAELLGVTPNALIYGAKRRGRVTGRRIQMRSATAEDYERGVHASTRYLFRVADEPSHEELDDLRADLAGCEVLIEDLEAGLLDRDERLEALRAKIQALEAQNKKLSVELRCDVSTAPAVEQIAEALANENERLKEALAHTTEDFKKFRNEVSGESMRAYQAGKREAIESRRVKTIVRRAALRALSKVQAWVGVVR